MCGPGLMEIYFYKYISAKEDNCHKDTETQKNAITEAADYLNWMETAWVF